MDDHRSTHDDTGAEGGDNPQKDTLPAAPSPPEDDSPLGDTDQHSKVPTPPAKDVPDRP
jgi:hypothetical protein